VDRCIFAPTITFGPKAGSEPLPVFLPNRSLGGANATPETKGVTNGTGARNLHILVKTWGKVTYVGSGTEKFFYIDDGSQSNDRSGHTGLKVNSRELSMPALGSMVMVTGISSSEELNVRVVPVLKPRRQSDIVVVVR
jgi:hypothetical protein